MIPMAIRLIALLVLATPSFSQTVNIFRQIPGDVDQCIRPCLFRPNNPNADVGSALNCGAPYQEKCYCVTDSDEVKAVSRHIDSCAQASCSDGQESQDAETMRHYYASYCMGNGYSAEAMEEWYTGTEAHVTGTETATVKDMWGWSTGTGARAHVFPDATGRNGHNDEDNGGSSLTSFKLLFVGMPILVALSQWI
ncbi:transmembrane SKG6 [Fusarium phyllophilum]|uniref:Transmembrane SKG6 n=1 Tax=Fusarium phyllophilum TaxID=47803 RepID=A0A8H5IZH7_9HYPO|nr:transmembrane SKG6 [Fusarium phyllophilum]